MGLGNDNNFSIGRDITYELSKALTLHAYYTYQKIFYNYNSLIENATCNGNGTKLKPGPGCLNNGSWNQKTDDQTHTFGVNLEWHPTDKLKVRLDYELS